VRRTLGTLCAVATLLAGGVASADAPASSSRADALFNQGVKLFDAGKTHEACEKFAESMAAEPANGTLQDLALCHEKDGRRAEAYREFMDLETRARLARQPEREVLGRQHAAAIAPTLGRLELRVLPDANVDEVRIDGAVIARDAWEAPVAVDPGEHGLSLSAPGKATRERRVSVAAGGTQTFYVGKLEDAVAPEDTRGASRETTALAGSALGGRRLLGVVVGGVGVAGLALGGAFGLVASSKWSQAKRDCNPSCTASSPAIGERDDARSAATVSTVAFVAGAVGVAAGAVLFVTAPARMTVSPSVGAGSAGILVRREF
jgi:hypothetical protein